MLFVSYLPSCPPALLVQSAAMPLGQRADRAFRKSEVRMTLESRRLAGILLIVFPTVIYGGVTVLTMIIRADPGYVDTRFARTSGARVTRMRVSCSSSPS